MKWMSVCSETASRTPTCAEVPRNISTWPLLQSIQKRHCWVARYSDIQNFPFRSWWVPGCIMLSPSTWGGAARERVYDDVPILQKYPDTVFISSLEVTAPFIDWNAHETSAELYKMSVLSNSMCVILDEYFGVLVVSIESSVVGPTQKWVLVPVHGW